MKSHTLLLWTYLFASHFLASAELNVYSNQVPLYTQPNFAPFPQYTAPAAYDPNKISAPPPPSPPITAEFPVQLYSGGMSGLSIPQSGAFVGFSVELSVADEVFGKNGEQVEPIFLNLLANIKARAGHVVVRLGGNTQERAVFFPDGLPNGGTIRKTSIDPNTPTDTPLVEVGVDLLHAMASISHYVNAYWFVGVPFNDTTNPRLEIAEYSEQILGPYLLGFQLGNEPDLFAAHGLRPQNYSTTDYITDFNDMVQAIQNNSDIHNKTNLIGPSICCLWTPQQIFDIGYVEQFGEYLGYLAVEKYPDTHCPAGNGTLRQTQDAVPSFLSHDISTTQMQQYGNLPTVAVENKKPLIMMETNTASCGGFPGFSDTFGAALFGIDWALQMAYYNFSGAMMHLGGQNAYYNPFTPPPGSLLGRANWTVGPIYYSALIVAEVFGPSNNSQIIDLFQNENDPLTPGYAIYENGTPTKVALVNFIDDPSGANNYVANISIGGRGVGQAPATPSHVRVKYFIALSVATQYEFQWAGQTFGSVLRSNGILQREQNITTIACLSDNVCQVPVPAPGFALVFLTEEAFRASSPSPDVVHPFATTVTSVIPRNTATIDPQVLATSNGHGGKDQPRGATSYQGNSSAIIFDVSAITVLVCITLGAVISWFGFIIN